MPDYIRHSKIKLFADDAKIYKNINNSMDRHLLQTDLDAIGAWSADWLLKFNANKCSVLQTRINVHHNYYINGTRLVTTNLQKDLGVILSNDLKPANHISNICKKANQRIGMIRRCFSNHTPAVISPLYRSIVRPLVETCSPVWNPWLVKDINRINKVQDRCIKLCNGTIHLEPLTIRRLKADLCEVYKIITGKIQSG